MGHALRTTVEDFIQGLKAFEQGPICKGDVARYVEATRLSAEALKPYTYFRDELYTRNLIYRDKLFEVMAICWSPGQKTAVHTHNGQLGWMTIAQGEVEVHNFKYLSCNAPQNQNVVGMDCLAGATEIHLDRLETVGCATSSRVYCVDKMQSIHQIESRDRGKTGCVSVHIYSLPIDSCVAFDLANQRCFRRTFTYYSQYGKLEMEVDQPADSGKLATIKPVAH